MKKSVFVFLCAGYAVITTARPLSLSLSSDTSVYTIGHPVVVYTTVRNTGREAVAVSSLVAPEFNDYIYSVTGPSGTTVRFSPVFVKDAYDPKPVIAPGRSVSGSARIFFGAAGYTFPEPGTYTVSCSYGTATPAALRLRFTQPSTPAGEALAEAMLNEPEAGMVMMFESGDEFARGISLLDGIAAAYPKTAQAGAAAAVLATLYARGSMNFVTKKPRGPDVERSRGYIQAARNGGPDPFYLHRTFLAEMRNLRTMKNEQALGDVRRRAAAALEELGRPGAILLEEQRRLEESAAR